MDLSCHACGKRFRSALSEAKHRHNFPVLCTRNRRFKAFIQPRYKPSSYDCNIIKHYAIEEARSGGDHIAMGNLLLEPRWSVGPGGIYLNGLLAGEGHDLHDYGAWADFRKGIELTFNRDAEIDFYIRRRNGDRDLCGNVQAIVAKGRLQRVEAQGRVLWQSR